MSSGGFLSSAMLKSADEKKEADLSNHDESASFFRICH